VGKSFPKLKDNVFVEVIFDPKRLRTLASGVQLEKKSRAAEIGNSTEEDIDWFIGCTGCSPFAPDHVCIVTPQRPPQCGRPLGMLKTGALYSYDDMTNIHHGHLQQGVNSFVIIDKGTCLGPQRGEWSGVNAHVVRMTRGRTRRVFLHSLDGCPHTGCGCFQMILFGTDKPRPGIGVMERGYAGRAPDGRQWKDLHYQLAGKQAPGLTGAAVAYLKSPKFLLADGGWASVVWVSPKVKALMGDCLPASVDVGPVCQ
jgi:acetyl-CoA decarbonylase/synthase complex subunit beta